MLVTIKNARLAFPALFDAKQVNGEGDPRFSAVFIIDPSDKATVKALDEAVAAVAKEKWGAKAGAVLEKLKADRRVTWQKSPKTNKNGDVYAGFEDTYHIGASTKARPMVIDADKTPLVESDGKPYAGCYVWASIDLWAQDNTWGRRINGTLRWVQFARDGEAFGGGTRVSENEFADLSAGADDNDPLAD